MFVNVCMLECDIVTAHCPWIEGKLKNQEYIKVTQANGVVRH